MRNEEFEIQDDLKDRSKKICRDYASVLHS